MFVAVEEIPAGVLAYDVVVFVLGPQSLLLGWLFVLRLHLFLSQQGCSRPSSRRFCLARTDPCRGPVQRDRKPDYKDI